MTENKKSKPLGMLLKEKGIITEECIRFALQEQRITKEKIGEILERLGFITGNDVVQTLSEQNHYTYLDVDTVLPDENILKLFNKKICLNNIFLPIRKTDDVLEVAAYNLGDDKLIQMISRQTGLIPKLFISEQKKIIQAVNKFYYFLENPVERLIEKEVNLLINDLEKARAMDGLIKNILHLAVKMRATDIHIRPMKRSINIAFRIDGVMTSVMSLPGALNRIITGLKMQADMDIAEQRLPQDGRFSSVVLNNDYDFRVSTIVSSRGESIVLRILSMESAVSGLEELGFFKAHIKSLEKMFNEPFGIILLTGPTGSGKSTTLFAGIRRLNLLEKNVITVEEPIEYEIPLIRQTQVNEKAGYSFSGAIRHFLRHDPDVILVGEIRDMDTAATAISASATGHLVLSTMHTNSAVGTIPRLRDLGVRPFLIADSLVGVVSQRLVRKICRNCKTAYRPSKAEQAYFQGKTIDKLYKGKGCELCTGSGYFGRTLVYELLSVDREVSQLIETQGELNLIREAAGRSGFMDIYAVTRMKVKQGITTMDEAVRAMGHIRQT